MSLLNFASDQVMAIDQTRARAMCAMLPTLMRGVEVGGDVPEQFVAASKAKLRRVTGKVAVVPIHGVIEQRLSWWSYLMGDGCGTDECTAAISEHLNNKDVQAIVLHVDSPGGTVSGVEELSDFIYKSRAVKPIYAIADSMAASAGYWTASAAEKLFVTSGGEVGSIGVYIMHVDWSKNLEMEGIKVEFVKAGKFKIEANAYEPLSDEGRDYLQEIVDTTYTKFIKAVARNRDTDAKTVRENFGQGRCLMADAAKAAGMVDRVVSFRDMLGELLGSTDASGSQAKAVSTEILRLRHEARKRSA